LDMYGSSADSLGYVQAASPQPSGFASIAVSIHPATGGQHTGLPQYAMLGPWLRSSPPYQFHASDWF
jgi:hypothetical protein